MPKAGEIYLFKNFEFEDHSRKDKFFIVLNTSTDFKSPILLLKATSQYKNYPEVKQGCNPQKEVFFIPVDSGCYFDRDTYLPLPRIIQISTEDLLKGSLSTRQINKVSSLSPDWFKQLKQCLKKFKGDISQRHWGLIFQ